MFPYVDIETTPPPLNPQIWWRTKQNSFLLFFLLLAGHRPTPAPPLKRNPWSPGGATNPWDASGDELCTDSCGLSGAWLTVAFSQNELIFFLFHISPLSLLLPLLIENVGWEWVLGHKPLLFLAHHVCGRARWWHPPPPRCSSTNTGIPDQRSCRSGRAPGRLWAAHVVVGGGPPNHSSVSSCCCMQGPAASR